MLNEHLENLIKGEIQNKTMLNTNGTKLTPKLSTDMVSPPRKPLLGNSSLKLTLNNFSLKTQGKDFGNLGAYQEKETCVRNERWDRLFIGKVCYQLSNRAADIRQP
jgi:hypothetical protein